MIRTAVAVLLALAGAAVLVLAWQVHAWESRMRDDDLRFQATPAADGLWATPGGPGAGLARRLLAVGDDIRFRTAEQQFVRVHLSARSYAEETERLAEFGQSQSALETLARSDPEPERRSRAANLLGILLWENADSAQENAPLLLRQSVDAFRRAIRASPRNDDAKINLEVLLTLLQPTGERRRDAPSVAGPGAARGAGIAAAGSGY